MQCSRLPDPSVSLGKQNSRLLQSQMPQELTHHQITTRQPQSRKSQPSKTVHSWFHPVRVTRLPWGKADFQTFWGHLQLWCGEDSENTALAVRPGGQNSLLVICLFVFIQIFHPQGLYRGPAPVVGGGELPDSWQGLPFPRQTPHGSSW